MADLDKLVVRIEADLAELKKGMKRANQEVSQASSQMSNSFKGLGKRINSIGTQTIKLGSIFAVAFGGLAIKSVIDTGMQIENLQIRLKALFGNVEEGSKAFNEMVRFASRVPFSLEEIQAGSGSLAVVADDAQELAKIMEITGNVAAVSGLTFVEASQQIQRAFGNGIASADLFRDRGVTALAGFEAGATYSAEETYRVFEELFSGNGKFSKVTNDLANSLTGTLSMLGDNLFQFKKAISEDFFKEVKNQFGSLNQTLVGNQDRIIQFGEDIGKTMAEVTVAIVNNLDKIKMAFVAFGTFLAGSVIFRIASALNPLRIALIAIATLVNRAFDEFDRLDKIAKPIERGFINQDKALAHLNKTYDLANGELRDLEDAQKDIKKSTETLSGLFENMSEIIDGVKETVEDAGQSVSDAFGAMIAKGENLGDALKNIFRDAVAEVVSLIFHLTVMKPLLEAIKAQLDDINAKQKNVREDQLINTAINAMTGGFGGFMANGGAVQANTPYVVGEKGPEMFVPNQSGTIIPNNQMGPGGITINQNLSFSTGIVPTVRAEVLTLLPQIKQETINAVAESRSRGGAFARTLGA
tara:strand:- start:2924 stop:4678 length:1755 start_codon:yes stop_codon:yes gene_type:complete